METLIINKRRELPLRKKLVWDIVTVALWIGWIYLWKPLLIVMYKMLTLHAQPNEIWKVILSDISVIPFHQAVIMLITTPAVLFILSRANRHRAASEHLIYQPEDYAAYFGIDEAELKTCADERLITVYHDEHGHVTRLDNRIDDPKNNATLVH